MNRQLWKTTSRSRSMQPGINTSQPCVTSLIKTIRWKKESETMCSVAVRCVGWCNGSGG